MKKISVKMQHTEETIRRLAKVQYNTYCMGQKLVTLLFSIGLLVLGTVGGFDMATSLALLAFGCWTLTARNAAWAGKAKKIIASMKGDFPVSAFVFDENGITISGDGKTQHLPYTAIYGVVYDPEYLYLFISKFSAYMVPLASAGVENSTDLKAVLAEKVACPVEKAGSLWTFNMGTLKQKLRKRAC